MKAQQQKAAGAAYLDHIKGQKVEIVDVLAPSGFTFKFEKPSKFSMLFGAGQLPLAATNGAVQKWQEEGVGAEGEEGVPENQVQLIKAALSIRDKVLRLSHTPKLVVGLAQNDNELSTDDVADEDLDYLFKWVAAGGEVSAMLGTFPGGSQPSVMASASRQKQRLKTERFGRDK